ncbi:hypothetical protein Tco_0687790 [Tanacetum coccineum]
MTARWWWRGGEDEDGGGGCDEVATMLLVGGRNLAENGERRWNFREEEEGLQRGLDELIERRSDGALYYLDRIWVTLKGDVRTMIMDKAYKSKYFVHPGADKMLRAEQDQRPSALLQQMCENLSENRKIAMDFVTKLPRTSSGHDTI